MTDTTAPRAPRTSWCWWCHRAVRIGDDDARRVVTAEGEEWVCGRCWERADAPVPLDYMREEADDDRG